MNLFVFSSNRALAELYNNNNFEFLPEAKSIKEFFDDIIIIPNKTKIPKYLRSILLWNATYNIEIENLGFDRAFLRFLENSTFLLNFFDELESSMVNIDDIDISDTYGDYSDHLRILNKIYKVYLKKIEELNLYDIGYKFNINEKYLKYYKNIFINIDGVLSSKDFHILKEASKYTNINISFSYSKYNAFMFDRILPNKLEENTKYTLNINKFEILDSKKLTHTNPKINVYGFEMRINQALLVIAKINEWLKNGYESIAVIVPDEEFSKYLQIFDIKRNLNYAMGIKNIALIKKIKKIREVINIKESKILTNTQHSNIESNSIILDATKSKLRNVLSLINLDNELELLAIEGIFENLSYDDIFEFLLSNIDNIDDNNGGKVKVIGVLESRGVSFERVIIVDFNEDLIPKLNNNDMFLNTNIRKHTKIPTLKDKENLQRHYYYTLIQNAKNVEIAFCKNKLPSSLLNELKFESKDGDAIWRFFPKEINKTYKEEIFIAKNTRFNLSASSLKIFMECKLKFYFKYICNINNNEEKEENDSSILHNIFKNLGENFDVSKLPNLIKEFTKKYKTSKRLDIEIIKNNLQEFIKEQTQAIKNGTKIIAQEVKKEFSMGNFNFLCYIDRIDKINDQIYIIDYKLKKDFNIKNETYLQLLIYKKALQNEYDNITCLYYDLYKNKKYIMDSNDELECEKALQESLNELNGEIEFNKCEDKNICKYCDYKYICNRY
ncbi:PD-(D/E)XK nuclease family protein [Helicobacter sp. MIT 14-3879]|uniref:PD-(D/E)XK nuclease family protein n=1 Tax=Helicobacter sp. MIT 14-3879 TaxID=2040649 RepID=UPI000E1E502B|nr:PD-(D/E)XK nuclease family protein [Helicobacter sp. MIT 14-3879]RDU64007.1 hypothetical protein CQA44_05035 [Helicobacter sp. MIT 14-3879]